MKKYIRVLCRDFFTITPLSNQDVYEDRTINRMKANCFTQEALYCQHYIGDSELQTLYSRYCTADSIQQIPHFRHYTVNSALQALYSR
jgi:hypothetical protein